MNQYKTLIIQTSTGLECILLNEIVRIEALGSYSKLYFTNRRILVVSKVLHWFENRLPKELFVRIHRSHLISIAQICQFSFKENQMITLKDNSKFEVARRKKTVIKKMLTQSLAA